MWTVIKRYYLFTFIGLTILFTLKLIATTSSRTLQEDLLIILAISLPSSLIIGTLYYFQDTKWGPKKREKRFSKTPFKQLLSNGFKREANFAIGNICGYTVIIAYTWHTGKPAINIDVLFDLRSLNDFITPEEIKQIHKRNKRLSIWSNHNFSWTRNSIGHLIEYSFDPPSYKHVIVKAEEMIAILIKEGLKPISLDQTKEIIPPSIDETDSAKLHKSIS